MSAPDLPIALDNRLSEFEEAWRAWQDGTAQKPSLDAHWNNVRQTDLQVTVTPEQWDRFWSDLLYAELWHLSEHGEQPRAVEYEGRYPDRSCLISDVFGQFSPVPVTKDDKDTDARRETLLDIAGYEIHGKLGIGGMGVVYLANDISLSRPVAIKMIRDMPWPHRNQEVIARFQLEANALASLQHANILQVYTFGFADNNAQPYFVLEFCPNGSLRDMLSKEGKLAPWRAAQITEILCGAVAAAHESGIVHRDLKPGNILIARDGTYKVADFGLAKLRASSAPWGTRTPGLGETVGFAGTRGYAAPEQFDGANDVGPAADIYALGVIFYEMLTGKLPPHGNEEQVRRQPVSSPRLWAPDLPASLEAICLQCLEKQPGKRYGSATALAESLRQARESVASDEELKGRLKINLLKVLVLFLGVPLLIAIWFRPQNLDLASAAQAFPAVLLLKSSLILYYLCWACGLVFDAEAQLVAYAVVPREGKFSSSAYVVMVLLCVVFIVLYLVDRLDVVVGVLAAFFLLDHLGWLFLNQYTKDARADSQRRFRQGEARALFERLRLVDSHVYGWWKARRGFVGGVIIAFMIAYQFGPGSEALHLLFAPLPAELVVALSIFVFVVVVEGWIWIRRFQLSGALRVFRQFEVDKVPLSR